MTAPRNTAGWIEGRCYADDREYPTLNPPRREHRRRAAPPVESDVRYGPFTIRCMYRTRDIGGPVKAGYLLIHVDSEARWADRLYRSVPDARALGNAVARHFEWAPWYPDPVAAGAEVSA